MPVEHYTKQDGVFVHSGTRCSLKDTPLKEFKDGLKKVLEESGRSNTAGYVLENTERYARARLEAPELKEKKGQSQESFQRQVSADSRQRRDCERLLKEIDFLKTIIGRKETDNDFLMARFYYLGVLAQQTDIRPIEPLALLEAAKSENSLSSRKLKQLIIREAIGQIFLRYPKTKKSLGPVLNKMPLIKTVELHDGIGGTFALSISGDQILIARGGGKTLKYKTRSIQTFIDELK